MSAMYEKIVKGEERISLIGLGYVGLPIALEFAKKTEVIGFDIKEERVALMKQGIDPSKELKSEAFENTRITFTSDPEKLREASFHIVAVPTPTDKHNMPDLTPVLKASETVGKILKKGDYVVYESTVYPGCTEEDCVPVLEQFSGLKYKEDFKVGFSPERINPGDKVHTLTNIVKVTSGCDAESAEEIARIYEMIITAGVHRASSIKVAESAKIIENTQRDINIAFMNELSVIFNKLNINTYEVLEAAGTKWNFLKFFPGLVGGHCIGVDPYYLLYKAKAMGYHAQMIDSGRAINDGMGSYVGKETTKRIIATGKSPRGARVLLMGVTFKENVSDIRNSKVVDVIRELEDYGINVDAVDPFADKEEVYEEYGFTLSDQAKAPYEAVIVAVGHDHYLQMKEQDFMDLMDKDGILVDLKGLFRNKINTLNYWSL